MHSERQFTSDQLAEVQTLLSAALALPASGRAAFLEANRGRPAMVQEELRSLLGLHEAAREFLVTPLPELLGAAPREEKLRIGQRLGSRYRLESVLAQSGFATVYRALDERVGDKPVVVKLLDRLSDRTAIQGAFRNEVQSLSGLNHPGLVGVSDTGQAEDGSPYLVLAFVPGITLRQALAHGPLAPDRVRRLVGQTARALAAAHKEGIAHLDVKPENIVISDPDTKEERITLIDFGIARIRDIDQRLRNAGTERYIAPEQRAAPGPACDIYSLGLVAFEALTGRMPAGGAAISRQLPRVRWRRAVVKALELEPSRRPASAAVFAEWMAAPRNGRRIGAAVLLLSVALATALWFFRPLSDFYEAPAPLLTSLQTEFRPAFSPDGGTLYYVVAGEDGKHSIYQQAMAGGGPVPVAAGADNYDQPHVSPDGKRLGYLRVSGDSRAFLLRDTAGNLPAEDLGGARNVQAWDWLPGGESIVASVLLEDRHLQVLSRLEVRSKQWTNLLVPGDSSAGYHNPAVSPDGRMLAFVRRMHESVEADIFVVSIDASLPVLGAPRRITSQRLRVESLQWTPDSRDLVFAAGPLGQASLWRVSKDGGAPRAIPGTHARIEDVAIPAKSWKLAYSTDLADENIWRLNLPSRTTSLVSASSYDDEGAQLSPDGKLIQFASERSGNIQVWIAKSDGSNPRRITNFKNPDLASGLWDSDGKSLIVSVRSRGRRIFIAPAADGFQLRLLLENASASSLSADGRRLYFIRNDGKAMQLWVADYPLLRDVRKVNGEQAYSGVESPDGKWLYFCKRQENDGLWRQRLPDGPVERVVERLRRRNLYTTGKQGIFYIAATSRGRLPSLLFQPYGDRRVTELFSFSRDVGWGLDLSPDERSVLFTQMDSSNADLMVIGSFR